MLALMGENGGRGRWLSPEEVVAAGLADTIIGVESSNKKTSGIFDRVRAWFSPAQRESEQHDEVAPISDVNVLHLPDNSLPATSAIALEEGQSAARKSSTMPKDAPSLEGVAVSHNALAYADDMRNFKTRGL